MHTRPASQIANYVVDKLNPPELGGLTDQHLKFLTFFMKEYLKIENFRFAVNCKSVPKTFTIHTFDKDGKEIYINPKPAELFDKILTHLNLPLWSIGFNKKDSNVGPSSKSRKSTRGRKRKKKDR